MKRIKENIFLVEGDLYTNMNLDVSWLSNNIRDSIIHVRGDVFFGVLRIPRKSKPDDYYLDYESFLKNYGSIYDVIAFSKIYAG